MITGGCTGSSKASSLLALVQGSDSRCNLRQGQSPCGKSWSTATVEIAGVAPCSRAHRVEPCLRILRLGDKCTTGPVADPDP